MSLSVFLYNNNGGLTYKMMDQDGFLGLYLPPPSSFKERSQSCTRVMGGA